MQYGYLNTGYIKYIKKKNFKYIIYDNLAKEVHVQNHIYIIRILSPIYILTHDYYD